MTESRGRLGRLRHRTGRSPQVSLQRLPVVATDRTDAERAQLRSLSAVGARSSETFQPPRDLLDKVRDSKKAHTGCADPSSRVLRPAYHENTGQSNKRPNHHVSISAIASP